MNLGNEGETVEFKKSTSELKEGISSIAAMLNKHGRGEVFFGVKDDGEVIGQQIGKSTLRDISQAISNEIRPAVHPIVEKLSADDGKEYIRISFQGAEGPYAYRGVYRTRVADEDIVMSDDELRSVFLSGHARKIPWDQWESERPIEDIDENELRAFVERGNACGRIPEPFTTLEDTLARLSLMRNNKLTNAAEVLFCPSLTTQLKMGILGSHSRTEILDLHQEQGTLFGLVRKAEHYILVNTRRKFVIESSGPRREVPELPPTAVREVLFNAFAHRDPLSRGVVQIDIYSDAVEITNPGWFVDGQDPTAHLSGEDRSSLSRNALIVDTLHKSGDIEAYGTGIPRIKAACDDAGLKFEYRRVPIGTTFVFHRNDAFAGSDDDNLRGGSERFGEVRESSGKFGKELSVTEQTVVDYLTENGPITTTKVVELTGFTERGAQKLLKRLQSKGLVSKIGAGRSTRYVLTF